MLNRSQRTIPELIAATVSKRIVEALKDLRFGSVEIVIHDGRVVQIERKEKWRVNPGKAPRPGSLPR